MNDGSPVKFVSITQAEYDSLLSKDPGTLYFVSDGSSTSDPKIIVDNVEYARRADIDKIKFKGKLLDINSADKSVDVPSCVNSLTSTQYQFNAYNNSGVHANTMTIQKVNNTFSFLGYDEIESSLVFNETIPNLNYVDSADANLQAQIDALGEPFRIKNWAVNNLNITIPSCQEDVSNTNIPKLVFSITGEEGENYQIIGMLAYELFDASGNRLNFIPVCQFTGNGQKELSVRGCVMGPNSKTARKISAWVLLKHR